MQFASESGIFLRAHSMNFKIASVALAIGTCVGAVLAPSAAFGHVLIAGDNFNSYASGNLSGANGGTGWGSTWADPSPANSIVTTTVSGDSPMSGQAVRITGNSNDAATRKLGATVSDNVIIRFDFQFDAGTISNNDFLGLWFGSSGGPNIGLKANCGGSPSNCTADLFARTSGTDSGGTLQNITLGTTYSLMGYLQKTGASAVYNRIDLWVNPTADEMMNLTGADAFDTGASSVSSFDLIGFRSATLSTGDALLVDNLSISKVPEPGSLALVGLALAGVAAVRRRSARSA